MLILVRHALPAATPDVPPDRWVLSPAGQADAAELMAAMPKSVTLVSSPEPKAWQTLGGGDEVARDSRFREVERPREPWGSDFREARAAYVGGERHSGWESHADVVARFQHGVNDETPADGTPVAIATHGMAMTTWLVGVGVLSAAEAGAFWAGLRYPDAHVVDVAAGTVFRYNGSA